MVGVVGGVGAVGMVGGDGRCESGGRAWEVRAARAIMGGASCTDDDGGSKRWEVVGVNYVLWLGGGVFDFFAGLIHSLSDAALL